MISKFDSLVTEMKNIFIGADVEKRKKPYKETDIVKWFKYIVINFQ